MPRRGVDRLARPRSGSDAAGSRSASSTSTSSPSSSGPRRVGDAVAVGEVGKRCRTGSPGSDARRGSSGTGVTSRSPMRSGPVDLRRSSCGSPPPFGVARIEHVAEHPADVVERRGVAVARHRAAHQRIEPPHVVHAEDVIGVPVGEEDRVNARDAVAQRLRAQVGPGVDEEAARRRSRRRSTDGAACRGDRSSGRSRSRTRSSARRARCPCRER